MIETYTNYQQYNDYNPAIHQDIFNDQLTVGQTVALSWRDRTLVVGIVLGFTPKKVRVQIKGSDWERIMFPKAMAIRWGG